MTKAEMEEHRAEYYAQVSRAGSAEQQGLYREAVELALASWDHIDAMMQYERKYDDREFVSIEGIDIVLKHAPLLFAFESLEKLEVLLTRQRRIEKNTSADLGESLSRARSLMWEAHRLWDYLERHLDCMQDELRRILGGEQDRWRSIAERWEKMGLLRRTPEGGSYRLTLSTQMGEAVSAKCPSCGAVGKAPKSRLLEEVVCPKCRAKTLFVLLSRDRSTST